MRDGRRIAARMVASVFLTLAVSLPAWGAAVPSQNITLRLSHPPTMWLTPGEMIRGSRQRADRARLVIRAAPERARADEASSDTHTSLPVPPPTAHRALPRHPGALVSQDDGPTRRRLSTAWVAFSSSRPGRVAHTRAREIAHTGASDARDSIFHEAHAPPLSSSFV